MNVAAKEKIQELYQKYLELSKKHEKLESVNELMKKLQDEGIVVEWSEVSYDSETATASVAARKINDDIEKMLSEVAHYLGAWKWNIVITTEERQPNTIHRGRLFAKRAEQLGMIVTTKNYRDYVRYMGYYEIARTSNAIAYIEFEEDYNPDP